MDMRELKGLELAARSRIAFENGAWLVPSQAGSDKYRVVIQPGAETCTCEDFTLRGGPCKHIHAARITRERDGGPVAPFRCRFFGIVAVSPYFNVARSTMK